MARSFLKEKLGARSLEPGAWSLEPGAWSLEPGAWSLELGAWSLEPGAWSLERVLGFSSQAQNSYQLLAISF